MPKALTLKSGQHYRVAVTGFVLIHYVRGEDDSERRCVRRELQHGETITCLQSSTATQPALKFRTEDGVEGTWFPTDSDGKVPTMALVALPGESPDRKVPGPVSETRELDLLDTHFEHRPFDGLADTDAGGLDNRRSKLPPIDRLKRAWQRATSGERIAFMEWVLREEAAAEEREKAAREEED